MDRNMSRKEVMYLDLEKEVARLNKERAILVKETNDVIINLSGLKEKQMIIEKASKEIVSKAKLEAEGIVKKAKNIETEAISKKSTIEIKLINLEEQKKDLANSIKSNEGLEKSLQLAKKDLEEKNAKLDKILNLVKQEVR